MYNLGKIRSWKPEKRDVEYGRCIELYVVLNEVNSILQNVLGFTGNSLIFSKIIISVLCFIIIARCLVHLKTKEWQKFLLAETGMLFLYGYSFLLGVSLKRLGEWAVTTLGICVPLAMLAYSTEDKGSFIDQLYKCSWLVLVLLLVDTLGKGNKRYDIHFSQIFMFIIIIHLNQFFKTKKKFNLFIAIAEMAIVLVYGSRGPLIAIAVFICIRLLLNNYKTSRKIIYIASAILITIGVFYLADNYGYTLLRVFQSFGFNSRSLRLIIEGRFTSHDSGRSSVWETTMKLINEQPFTGWGIRGAVDRLGHPYPHNYFLDFWLSFGYLFGSILLVCSIVPMRKLFTLNVDSTHECIYIFFAASMVVLMISGTWFINYFYFIYMGVLLSAKKRKRQDTDKLFIYHKNM